MCSNTRELRGRGRRSGFRRRPGQRIFERSRRRTLLSQRILITGASVAGCAAAWWLGQRGMDVTVVERAPEFRDGGQNVDVRGLAREVIRRMGLERAALDGGTGETGTAWVDAAGRTVAEVLVTEGGLDGPTAEMEILRGDLARLLYDAARAGATWRFGDSVAAIEPEEGVVTFASGGVERFDVIVIAEGVGSRTREMVLPGANRPRWMDMTIAYFTIPRTADDDRRWRWFNAPGGRSVSLRPDRQGTARAMLTLQQRRHRDALGWDAGQQKAYLRQRFAGAGWQTRRVLDGMDGTGDFYFDVLRQVRLPRWAKGRVVLTGDAAWCVTPLGGFGASLALIGPYVLAGEMSRTDDLAAAFAAYERFMRPLVDKAQGVPKILPRLLHPRTRLGIGVLHGVLRLATRPSVRRLASRFDKPKDAPALPDYP